MKMQIIIVVTLFLISSSLQILAKPGFQLRIPNGAVVPGWPAVGHVTPEASPNVGRNRFGHDFDHEGRRWTKNLCMMDSDNDGRTNGEELGDPSCVWQEGMTPSRLTGITHPGIFDNFTANETSYSGNPKNDETGTDHSEQSGDVQGWKVAHAVFMILSFGGIIPCAALAPFYCRSARPQGKWREDHIKIMSLGWTLGIIGFLIAVISMGVESNLHGIVGVVLMTLTAVQATFAYGRFRLPSKSTWRSAHSYLGRIIIMMIPFQVFFGYLEFRWYNVAVAIAIGLLHFALLFPVFFLIRRAILQRSSEQATTEGFGEDASQGDFAALDTIPAPEGLQLT
jgi:hypothetical protein